MGKNLYNILSGIVSYGRKQCLLKLNSCRSRRKQNLDWPTVISYRSMNAERRLLIG